MATYKAGASPDFEKALKVGRPPNVVKLFPNSKALLVSGKVIVTAMIAKGKAMTMAANGRNAFVIRGALRAAQRANAALIIEIAKSEGGTSAYCAVNYWNIVVPISVDADLPNIQRITLVADKNPLPVIATFSLAPEVQGLVATRIKLAETCNVTAIVESDGKLHMGSKPVQVMIGGCGGE